MSIAENIFSIAKYAAESKGYTVQLELDAAAYVGPHTDRIFYKTPENAGVPLTVAKSLTEGKMVVFTTTEAVADAQRIIDQIEAA